MHGDVLRWGICCAGRIANDFVVGLSTLPSTKHHVQAVAASSISKATEFAKKHDITKVYDSYDKLSKDNDIDIVYIGSVHTQHYKLCKLMLEAGKPVICEKPICTHPGQVKSLFKLAKSKGLFCMEAIWSQFFPAYNMLKKAIQNGEIGDVKFVQCSMGDFIPEYSDCWYWISGKEYAGGSLHDRAVYPLQLVQLVFKDKPLEQLTMGHLGENGVDLISCIILKYSNMRMASLATTIKSELENAATICGTKGYIKIHSPFWCPIKIDINGVEHKFELPKSDKLINYRNSTGLSYQAEEVWECLKNNLLESNVVSHEFSLTIAEIVYKARKDIGYHLPEDEKWDAEFITNP